jgi:pimeloyl-ACP methyl ester carboxylesterase
VGGEMVRFDFRFDQQGSAVDRAEVVPSEKGDVHSGCGLRQVGKMGIPTLITAGRKSKGVSLKLSMQVHDIIEGSRLGIFERSGHCPNVEQPELFNRLVLDFFPDQEVNKIR